MAKKEVVKRPRTFFIEGQDEVLKLLESLPRVVATAEGTYTFQDRAKDFLAVFGGNSTREQGQRVLAQIHQICDPALNILDADKQGTLAWKSGMRRVMQEIMLCMVNKGPVKIEKTAPTSGEN